MNKWYRNPLYYVLFIIVLGLIGIIRVFQVNPQIANTYMAIFTIILALATVFLAYFTYISIKSSNDREKRDRKERLLNEIIEWASVEIIRWRPKGVIKEMFHISKQLEIQQITFSHLVDIMDHFIEMRGRNKYIINIASKIDKDLGKAVDNLVVILELNIENLAEWKSKLAESRGKALEENEERNYYLRAEEQENQIEVLSLIVIDEATRVKTENLN